MAIDSRVAGNDMIAAVVRLMTDVINEKDSHQILQIELGCMEILRQDIGVFQSQQQGLPEEVKVWLQLLHNSLAEAKRLLHRSGRRQLCLDWLVNNSRRQSQQIRGWNAFLNYLFEGFYSDLFQHIVLSPKTVNSHIKGPIMELLIDVIKEEDKRQIMQTDLRPLENLLQDFTTLFPHKPFIITLFQGQEKRHPMTQWRLLQIYLAQAKCLLDRSGPRQMSCLDRVKCNPRRLSEKATVLNAFFDRFYHVFQRELPMLVTSLQFLSSKPFYKLDLQGVAAPGFVGSGIIDAHTLSGEEAWMLFRRVAFRDERVSMDIEERARMIAEECRGRPLAIKLVAAAMMGQSSVHEWDVSLSSLKKVHLSFPATSCQIDAELYRLLRWSYDTLPNSIVKNCFLYCAMYEQGQEIDSRKLVEMWIGEGLIKSKQGAYIMEMAIGRNYVKLLVDRCFFHIINESGTNVLRKSKRIFSRKDVFPSIGVHDVIREMAVYIAQKEQNCVLMSSQNPPNLPENCTRISLPDNYTADLPTDLRCPNLASLSLQGNTHLELLPTELLLSRLTSLRVLNMSGCTNITSVPTSVGQLRLLQFLSLSHLPIKDLGEEVCHLSQLQFLDLSWCRHLESLPSQIGQLKNLKHLNLDACDSLKMIPREISELTSLSRLQLRTTLSVRMEEPASVWSLKGLQNLTELDIEIDGPLTDGIMETWSEMRHLVLEFTNTDLPHDMQSMKKLQSFVLLFYRGLTLPHSKFEHLEVVKLRYCRKIRELSPLEWLPNLKYLKLDYCDDLTELGIGSRVPSGYPRLEKLVLIGLDKLESLGGPSNTGVWDQRTLPNLRVLKIDRCRSLRRLPIGMEKLRNLCQLKAHPSWWEKIVWEDDNMKVHLQKIFVPSYRL